MRFLSAVLVLLLLGSAHAQNADLAICHAPTICSSNGPNLYLLLDGNGNIPASLLSNLGASTITVRLDGVTGSGNYPEAGFQYYGNSNAPMQFVLQNLSNGNNASGCYIMTSALGGNTTYYAEACITSGGFNQSAYSVETATAMSLGSSDSDLVIEANLNGNPNAVNGGQIIFVTSNPVSGNTRMTINNSGVAIGLGAVRSTFTAAGSLQMASGSSITVRAPFYINLNGSTSNAVVVSTNGNVNFNISNSTQAAGAAGALTTVSCPAGKFEKSGGCSCTGTAIGVETADINMAFPTPTVGGNAPTGWQCQKNDATAGLACAAFVECWTVSPNP